MDSWILVYMIGRNDSGNWVFEDNIQGVLSCVKSDIESAEGEAECTHNNADEREFYRREVKTVKADLAKIERWLPTAKHKDSITFDLYTITVVEMPQEFVAAYEECAPDFSGWE